MVYTCTYPSPLGNILLAADEVGLTGLWFEGQKYFGNTLPKETGFSEEEKRTIKNAVRGHRRLRDGADTLEKLLYEADKASRLCLSCPANRECNWSEEKKNMEIKI